MAQDNELILIDGSGYIFRAYYAMAYVKSGSLTNPQGVPVGAVYGFCNMLLKLLSAHEGARVAVIFDAARKNFRYDLYDQYKANRAETPEDLIPQFPLVREATSAFGLPGLEMEGYEADDLIATYARLAKAEGVKVRIVSSDKDLMQLVGGGIALYDPMKDKIIDEAGVFEKFGVGPDKVIDVQSLIGDSSDNVPGVPSIGPKTAAQLISEFGTLENLLDNLDSIKQDKRRQVLIENADMARLSKKLVTLEQNVPLTTPLGDIPPYHFTPDGLKPFFAAHGFKSLLTRLGAEIDAPPPQKTAATAEISEQSTPDHFNGINLSPIAENIYTLITDAATLKTWIDEAYENGFLAIDTETTSLTPALAKLAGISLCAAPGRAAYIPVGHSAGQVDLLSGGGDDIKQIPLAEAIALLKPLLEDPSVLKIGHNLKYDWQIFAKHGIRMTPCDDTMLLSYVLDGTTRSNGMDELCKHYFGHETIKYADVTGKGKNQVTFDLVSPEKACDYAAEDADITRRFHHVLKPRLPRESMTSVYEDIERPLIGVIGQMELDGIKVDPHILKSMSNDFGKKLIELEADIHTLAGTQFNVGSPKQIGEILFDRLGLQGGAKTKTGQWSTDVDVLEKLAAQGHDIVRKILDWRGLAKLKSTYTDALQEQINPVTGRVHTSFSMAGTSTGRLASSDPNLQNIPIRTEEGRKIREAFIAEDGHVLLSVDYSQVELRLAAEMANVAALKQAFRDNVDIHALTASQVFGVPLDQVTGDIRRQAKAVNFGIIYGISGWGLAAQLGISPGEASAFIKKYLSTFSEIQDYMERTKEEARTYGYVKTLMGRKCYIPNINASNAGWRAGAERQAINAPLQGTAADIMKRAMIKIPPTLQAAGLKARMLLQVHDELIFEVPEEELALTTPLIKSIMENVVKLDVPLVAEAGSGKSWAAAH